MQERAPRTWPRLGPLPPTCPPHRRRLPWNSGWRTRGRTMSATSCLTLRAAEVGGLQPPLRHRGAHLQRSGHSRNPLKVTVPIPSSPTDVLRLPSPPPSSSPMTTRPTHSPMSRRTWRRCRLGLRCLSCARSCFRRAGPSVPRRRCGEREGTRKGKAPESWMAHARARAPTPRP